MILGGFEALSLSDYPGKVSAVIFTQGCNFRCPFCHNGGLWAPSAAAGGPDPEAVLAQIERRRGMLDGVTVSGGEPTVQPDLPEFLARLKALDLAVKLDTNGSRPEVVAAVLADRLVDFIAMDVKAPLDRYARLAGVEVPAKDLRASIGLIAGSGLPHEFRTTHVEDLLTADDMQAIADLVPPGSPHRVQTFRPELAHDPALRREPSERQGAES